MHLGTALPALVATLVAAPVLSACGSAQPADPTKVQVVASTDVYGDVAATVGGDRVEVTAFITSASQDPHSYEASARDALVVSKADVVLENGGGYDAFMDQLLDSTPGNPAVINAVDVSGLAARQGGELNEHVWYDLPAMQKVADQVAVALGAVDPQHSGTYTSNARAFDAQVRALIDREAALKKHLGGLSVGITEPVPGYLLDAIGLDVVTPEAFTSAIEAGGDISVLVLTETLRLYDDHRVDALVYNEQATSPVTEQVRQAAEDAGVPTAGLTETLPHGDTYVAWMSGNLDGLDKALSQT